MKKKTPEQRRFEQEFSFVGGMSGDEKTVSHVCELMRSAGICCMCEGSLLYDLYVDRTKVDHAIRLLRAEKAKGWPIILPVTAAGECSQGIDD